MDDRSRGERCRCLGSRFGLRESRLGLRQIALGVFELFLRRDAMLEQGGQALDRGLRILDPRARLIDFGPPRRHVRCPRRNLEADQEVSGLHPVPLGLRHLDDPGRLGGGDHPVGARRRRDDAGGGDDTFEWRGRDRDGLDRRGRRRLDFLDRRLRARGHQQERRQRGCWHDSPICSLQSPIGNSHFSEVPIARSRSASASW
jgi:hypothetical protein